MRLIIFRTDKIGDLIVSSPVIGAIKAAHPGARIMLVASPYNVVAVQGLSGIDEVVLFEKNDKAATLQKIKAFKPTHTLVLSPKNDCYYMALQSGAQSRGGLLMEYRWLPRLLAPLLLTHSIFMPREKRPHQTDAILSLARNMGLAKDGLFPYRIARNDKAKVRAQELLKQNGITGPFIAVHLVDKWLVTWSVDDVRDFLKRAEQQTGLKIVATAGPADKILSAELANDFPLFKNLSFPEWAEVFAASRAVVTPDSAAVHVACALEKPLLALYLSSRLDVAVSEFGPRGTKAVTRPMQNANTDIPVLLNDLKALLT